MLKKGLLLPVLLLQLVGGAQTFRTPVGVAYTSLTAYSGHFSDAFSFGGNLGALGAKQQFAAGVYSEKRFLLKELGTYSASFVLPASSGNFGFRGDYAGGPLYNESSLGLAYARSLGSKVALGLQFNYLLLGAAGYGNASALNVDAGVIVHLSPQLNAGLQVYNPIGTSWGREGSERLPAVYSAGIGYDVSSQLFFGLDAEKAKGQSVSINAGMHYTVTEKLIARAGIRTATSLYYLGFGVQLKHFRVDVTASVHPYLGTTPGLLLLYSVRE
jgi:hypothetical protein